MCFPVNIAKFLILPILKNICKQLLFNFFNGSLSHGPKGLRSRLYYGVRLQGPSHRSSFCFYVGVSTFPLIIQLCVLHWLFLVAFGGFKSF